MTKSQKKEQMPKKKEQMSKKKEQMPKKQEGTRRVEPSGPAKALEGV